MVIEPGKATTSEVALSAATAKTVLQIATPTTHECRLVRLYFGFDGQAVVNEPIVVVLATQTGAGTMTALTPVTPDRRRSPVLYVTAQHTATVEPTTGTVLDRWNVHPQTDREPLILPGHEVVIGASQFLGLICTAPDVVNVIATMEWEEWPTVPTNVRPPYMGWRP